MSTIRTAVFRGLACRSACSASRRRQISSNKAASTTSNSRNTLHQQEAPPAVAQPATTAQTTITPADELIVDQSELLSSVMPLNLRVERAQVTKRSKPPLGSAKHIYKMIGSLYKKNATISSAN